MNHIAEEILSHSGVAHDENPPGRGSGRFGYGTGDNPYQHAKGFLARIEELKAQGITSEAALAKEFELSTGKFRARKAIAKAEVRAQEVKTARGYKEQGLNNSEIARKMGYPSESSIRNLLDENTEKRKDQAMVVAEYLKGVVDSKGMVDVGAGVERELGNISKEKLTQALEILQEKGYPVYGGGLKQITNPGKQTNMKVLCPPGTEHKEIFNPENVHSVTEYDKILTQDGSKIMPAFVYPESMDSKRLMIRYGDEGGVLKDGLIEIRRGVPDLSLQDAHHAQVRILVDGTHYIKGMAVYSDGKDMPPGVDVIFNTNKKSGTPALGEGDNSVLKHIKDDPTDPFGSAIKSIEKGGQHYYISEDGTEKLSLINKRADEGDWREWADKVPSQFLSKQPIELVRKQLGVTIAERKAEHDEIMALTNNAVKRALLNEFALSCDSAAVNLKAASLPGQKYHVILPLTSIKNNEIYAPNYKDGERLALIRFPHSGTFEIPILTVNNKNPEGKRVIGKTSEDAVGINAFNAQVLSGADFDGDTVMIVPVTSKVRIASKNREGTAFEELNDFDNKMAYGPGSTNKPYRRMTEREKQIKMGISSNLITDMTIKGAKDEELVRAVKYNMVVIDAPKHNLDWKRCYDEMGIAQLQKRYQEHTDDLFKDGKTTMGAATLISRAKNEVAVTKRRGQPIINEDGSLSYKEVQTPTYTNKEGKVIRKTQKSTQMAEVSDARRLSAGYPVEEVYADYANSMKALANQSRKEAMALKTTPVNASAKATYRNEINSLNAKLNNAEKNAPIEREAQRRAHVIVNTRIAADPSLENDKEQYRKVKQKALTAARVSVGAKRNPVTITDREWEAIQAKAVPETTLQRIFKHTDMDTLRQRATPRTSRALSDAKAAQVRAMAASGLYTNQQLAERFGVSASTISNCLKGKN